MHRLQLIKLSDVPLHVCFLDVGKRRVGLPLLLLKQPTTTKLQATRTGGFGWAGPSTKVVQTFVDWEGHLVLRVTRQKRMNLALGAFQTPPHIAIYIYMYTYRCTYIYI